MSIPQNTQAILLLVARLGGRFEGRAKPLTTKEWGRFALWLREHSLEPRQLLAERSSALLNGWRDKAITPERIDALLSRGTALAIAMEKWERAGLWVLTRSDAEYPSRLKRRLRTDSPAVLFGCGNRNLLAGGGVAVVGSRNAPDVSIEAARRIGSLAGEQGVSVVSGGARGVDETALGGVLDAGGTAIGVLPDGLLKATTSTMYRSRLLDDSLVLVSPFNPEAGFSAGNAMARNKYIYCLSDAAIVVHSGIKGGTWNGATENAKHGWVPLWVLETDDRAAGNAELIGSGARSLTGIEGLDLKALAGPAAPGVEQPELAVRDAAADYGTCPAAERGGDGEEASRPARTSKPAVPEDLTLYDLFLLRVCTLCRGASRKPDELAEQLGLAKPQLNAWLERAVADGALQKKARPVRYEAVDTHETQYAMFDRD